MTELAFLGKGGSEPKPPTRVSDNLRSEDTVELLIGLGEGPWKSLKDESLRNLFIADTPLQAADGTVNFPDAEVIFHKGTADPEPILLFMGGTASGVGVNVNLKSNEPVTRTTTSGDFDAIDIRLRIDGLFKTTDEGDYLNEEMRYRIEVKKTSEPNSAWTHIPTNAGWEELYPSSTYPSGESFGAYYSIEQRAAYLQSQYNLTQTQAESEVMTQLTENASGPIEGSDFEAYRRNLRVYGATQSPVVKEIRIPVERTLTDTYDIRVTKLSPETTNTSTRELTWDIFELVSLERKAYPNTAMLQILLKSSDQLSNVPAIYGIYETLEMKVPTIFDPVTRSYDYSNGPWDGSFKIASTDDLAWNIYNLIHNEDHGIAKYYNINFSKYEAEDASLWWNACDPLTGQYVGVPRPNGNGTRPRITYNNVVDSPRNSMELLNYMAGSGNAVFYEDSSGTFKLRVEKAEQAKHIFTTNDIIDDFSYTYTETTSRYNDITVVYKNSKLPRFQEDRRRVFDAADIAQNGSKPFNFIAVGCTDTDEAIARAQHKLLTSLTEKETVTFTTTRKGMYVEPHDIILLSDPDMDAGESSRCVTLSSNRLEITAYDTIVPQGIAGDYIVTIQTSDGIFQSTVTDFDSVTNTITIADPVPNDVADLFSFSFSSELYGALKSYRAIAINPDQKDYNKITITAVEVNLAKYDLVDNFDGSVFNDVTEVDDSEDNVTSLNATVTERATDNGKVKDIELSWSSPDKLTTGGTYAVYMAKDDGPRVEVQRNSNLGYKVLDADIGRYQFSVAPVLLNGFVSTASRSVAVTIVQPNYGLPSVTGVTIQNKKDSDTTYIGKNVSIEWSVDTSEQWEGWASDKPHPDFAWFEIDVVDPSSGSIVHTYQLTDWKTKKLEIPYSDFSTFGLNSIRNFSVVVTVSDPEGNEGSSFSRNIQKPVTTLQNVTFEQPDDFSGRGRMKFDIPSDADFRGVKVWVSDTANAHTNNSNLIWNDAGTPVMDFEDGTNYISYQPLDIFGATGQTIVTTTFDASIRNVPAFIDETVQDILALEQAATNAAQDILDLETVYGDTASAAASANAALAARDAAQTHSSNAATAQSNSEAARNAALGGQTASEAARDASISAKDISEAARDASISAKDTALTHANSAATQAGVATTQANNAGLSASSASNSASAAGSSATSAGQSAAASETSRVAARTTILSAYPSELKHREFFASNVRPDLSLPQADLHSSWVSFSDPDLGEAIKKSGYTYVAHKSTFKISDNEVWRFTYDVKTIVSSTGTSTTNGSGMYVYWYDASGQYLTATGIVVEADTTVAQGVQEITADYASSSRPLGAKYFKPYIYINTSPSANGTMALSKMLVENVTSEVNASNFANAASTSAAQAQVDSNAAGQSASASSNAANAAQTARSGAETAETNAAQSATNASGSESSAANHASLAAQSAGNASSSANAASTQASIATTKANEAGVSAAASQASNVSAIAARDAAQQAETNANTSANSAAGSAQSAAASDNSSGQNASAAQSAQTAAETARSGAETAETNSAQSATNASGSESSAANHASLAAQSASNASSSANSASTQAGIATTKANEAGVSAQAAQASNVSAIAARDAAQQAETNSGNSANAAAGSAQSAAASDTSSSQNASSAQQAQTAAETARSGAETAQTSASTSASNAAGSASQASSSASIASNAASNAATSANAASSSASTATTQATNAGQSAAAAETSRISAQTSVLASYPSVVKDRQFFSSGISSSGAFWVQPELAASWVNFVDPDLGEALKVSGKSYIAHKALFKIKNNEVWRFTYDVKTLVNSTGSVTTNASGISLYWYEADGTFIYSQTMVSNSNSTVAQGVQVFSTEYNLVNAPANAAYFKPYVYLNSVTGSNGTMATSRMLVENVTSEIKAANSAAASAASATTASASETASSQSASAANNSNLAAQTAAGQASTSAASAATSANNASSSASTATTQAGLAATARVGAENAQANAAQSATASANSASSASASATSAGQSASTATSQAQLATTQAASAGVSASSAANSATVASGAASTATTQAGLAVSAAGDAVTTVIDIYPSDLNKKQYFSGTLSPNGATVLSDLPSAPHFTPVVDSDIGQALEVTDSRYISHKALFPFTAGDTWALELTVKTMSQGTGGTVSRMQCYAYAYDASKAFLGYIYPTAFAPMANGVSNLKTSFSSAPAGTVYFKPYVYFNTGGGNQDAVQRASRFKIYNATSETASKTSATAAANSASTASAASTTAGQFATSASTASNTATTAAGSAGVHASNAATSANTATLASNAAQSLVTVIASAANDGWVTNPKFTSWNDGAVRPVGWGSYNNGAGGGVTSRETSITKYGDASRHVTNGGSGTDELFGMMAYSYSQQNGGTGVLSDFGLTPNVKLTQHVVLESWVYLVSGSWNGTGLYLNYRLDPNNASYSARLVDFGVRGLPTGKWVKVEQFIDWGTLPTTLNNVIIYAMTNYHPFSGGSNAKDLIWGSVNVREATPYEIELGNVQNISGTSTTLSSVVAELQGRVSAHWQQETGVSGFTGTFISARTTNSAGVVSSEVSFGAREIGLYNLVGNTWLRAMRVSGGDVRISGNLEAGAGIYLGTGSGRWPVALQDRVYNEDDGTAITFGTGVDIGDYDVDFSTIGLDELGSGEAYRLRPINQTGTGFTAELKITTTGATTAVTASTNATSPSGPDHMVAKADTASYNDVYIFYISGTVQVQAFSEQENEFGEGQYQTFTEYFGSIVVETWFHDGTSWVQGPNRTLGYSQLGVNPNHSQGNQSYSFTNKAFSVSYTGTIRTSSTLATFGATKASNSFGGSLTDLNKVTYTKQGQTGTRSATPNGELCKITVKPRNQSAA